MASADDFSALSEVVAGRFRMRRLVAFGGMANIYEVEDLQTSRVGALKLLKARFRNVPDAVERLSREADAASQISDPHIVETLEAGRLPTGEPFLFMELLNGEPLDRVIARRGRLPIGESILGPAIVFHRDTTTVVPPLWTTRADASGNLILTKVDAP